MLILKLNQKNSAKIIRQAVAVLKGGGTIVYPTETAYGLGADFFNPKAIKKVYQIKGRNFKKPLSILSASLLMAKKLVKFDKFSRVLAKKYWPGALTLVLPCKNKPGSLAVRISSNKLAQTIVQKLQKPLTATSANLAGKGEFYSATEIIKQFNNKKYRPDLIINAGKLPKTKPSTIIKIENGKMEILRQGKIFPSLKS